MDSSGIALILRAEKKMKELDGNLCLSGIPEQPLRVLRAAGADKRLIITD
jgi:stage II sporulation protein AA (anti-sigma F factor antagonist)